MACPERQIDPGLISVEQDVRSPAREKLASLHGGQEAGKVAVALSVMLLLLLLSTNYLREQLHRRKDFCWPTVSEGSRYMVAWPHVRGQNIGRAGACILEFWFL